MFALGLFLHHVYAQHPLCAQVFVPSLCSSLGSAMDPLKVFLGQLHPWLIKPQFLEWLEGHVDEAPVAVHMKPNKGNGLQCAFVVFSTNIGAQRLVDLDGLNDPQITPDVLRAQQGYHGSIQC